MVKISTKNLVLILFVIILFVIPSVYYYLLYEEQPIIMEEEIGQKPIKSYKKRYEIKSIPTPNYDRSKKNDIIGVVLHHTAEPTVEKSISILTSPAKKVGTHVVIDTDGTRYIMAEPNIAVYHAGFSVLNGHEGCNYCTVGIEFQGNTLISPLTDDQIFSAIEYLMPIIEEYKIPLENIVTHEMVRTAYKKKHPNKRCSGKVDITPTEYLRFMKTLIPTWEEYQERNSNIRKID